MNIYIILGIIALILGAIAFVVTCAKMRVLCGKRRIKETQMENEIYSLGAVAIFCGMLLASASCLTGFGIIENDKAVEVVSIEEVCGVNCISYELVVTVAEHTHLTEQEVMEFFLIVCDDMDAWDAIKLLDNTLTDSQIDALLEISSMREQGK